MNNEPNMDVVITTLIWYYIIGVVLAFVFRILFLKKGKKLGGYVDHYDMNPFTFWLGMEPALTFVGWGLILPFSFFAFLIYYLPSIITKTIVDN